MSPSTRRLLSPTLSDGAITAMTETETATNLRARRMGKRLQIGTGKCLYLSVFFKFDFSEMICFLGYCILYILDMKSPLYKLF